jgi:dihydrofolate reductase
VSAVSELKGRVDGQIVLYASYQLGRTLLQHGLVDELRLIVFPAVLGSGERIFGEGSDTTALRLRSSGTIGKNLIQLAYEVVRPR